MTVGGELISSKWMDDHELRTRKMWWMMMRKVWKKWKRKVWKIRRCEWRRHEG